VREGFGCDNAVSGGGADILLFYAWSVVLPLFSALFYCRELIPINIPFLSLMSTAKIIYVFYQQSRETNQFLQSNGSVTRLNYFRILALACVDIFLTLPLGIVSIVTEVIHEIHDPLPGFRFQFYYGWGSVHSDWGPVAFTYSEVVEGGLWSIFVHYFQQWTSPILAIAIFSLFGLTLEARTTYWRSICFVGKLFGWTPSVPKNNYLDEMQFGGRSLATIDQYARDFPPECHSLSLLYQIVTERHRIYNLRARTR
jgi:hypothetical protein